MTNRKKIISDFNNMKREPVLALKVEKDVCRMLLDDDYEFSLVIFSANSMAQLEEKVKSDKDLPSARDMLFELAVRPGYKFTVGEFQPTTRYLARLPLCNHNTWGWCHNPDQDTNIELRIIYATKPSEKEKKQRE